MGDGDRSSPEHRLRVELIGCPHTRSSHGDHLQHSDIRPQRDGNTPLAVSWPRSPVVEIQALVQRPDTSSNRTGATGAPARSTSSWAQSALPDGPGCLHPPALDKRVGRTGAAMRDESVCRCPAYPGVGESAGADGSGLTLGWMLGPSGPPTCWPECPLTRLANQLDAVTGKNTLNVLSNAAHGTTYMPAGRYRSRWAQSPRGRFASLRVSRSPRCVSHRVQCSR